MTTLPLVLTSAERSVESKPQSVMVPTVEQQVAGSAAATTDEAASLKSSAQQFAEARCSASCRATGARNNALAKASALSLMQPRGCAADESAPRPFGLRALLLPEEPAVPPELAGLPTELPNTRLVPQDRAVPKNHSTAHLPEHLLACLLCL